LAVYLEFCKKCRRQFYIKHHQQKIVWPLFNNIKCVIYEILWNNTKFHLDGSVLDTTENCRKRRVENMLECLQKHSALATGHRVIEKYSYDRWKKVPTKGDNCSAVNLKVHLHEIFLSRFLHLSNTYRPNNKALEFFRFCSWIRRLIRIF
jgi:hypothetical protein